MSQGEWAPSWTLSAACREGDPDALFVTGAQQHQAKQVCVGCAAKLECLADALDNQIEFGVWGGMTERERRALLRRRPDVQSWRDLLLAAQAAELSRPEVIDMRSRQQRQARALSKAQSPGTAPGAAA
jgi:WhiB family redox-sensing transcriptional regulator